MTREHIDQVVLCVVLFFYTAMDGWRDAWLLHDWWPRHVVKWIAFYTLPLYLLWRDGLLKIENWKILLWLAVGGLFFWEIAYLIFK
jgi:hypothetical protein